jgi:membrane-associated protease RseP (regulator of RpoE activity)
MKTLHPALAALVALPLLSASATAQPILDRVEKLLRGQVDAAQAAPVPAEPAYLGLIGDDTPEPGRGVRVLQVLAGQPAAAAGLRVGDVIVKIDDTPIRTLDDMARALDGKSPGTKLAITATRQGTAQQLELTLGRRPGAAPPPGEELPSPHQPAQPSGPGLRLGVRTIPLTETVQRLNNLPTPAGAQVVSVTVGSPAERAKIPLGAVVTAVDGAPVNSPNALAAAIAAATAPEVELSFVHRGRPQRLKVALGGSPAPAATQKRELRARPPIVDPPGPADALPADKPAALGPQGDDRVAALEARLRELEARIKTLEAQLAKEKSPDAPQN